MRTCIHTVACMNDWPRVTHSNVNVGSTPVRLEGCNEAVVAKYLWQIFAHSCPFCNIGVLAAVMAAINLATTVLFIESKNSPAEAALKLPSNSDYVVDSIVDDATQHQPSSREGTPFITPATIICALLLTRRPFDPVDGWVFGSDEERCDFLLATTSKGTGVSGRHFRIHYKWTSRCLRLTNLSKHHTMMTSPKLGKDVFVRDSRVILPGEDITVTAGIVSLSVHIPAREEYQGTFDKNLDTHHDEFRQAVPRLAALSFARPLQETPQVILGKRNRAQYLTEKEGDIGKGGFATVSKALDPITGDLYAAEKFRKVSPKELEEIKLHQQLSHVSLPLATCG